VVCAWLALNLIHPGFKEFHDYCSSPSDAAFSAGVESMRRATQKYAKYQTKWILHKFLPAARAAPDTQLYVLDTTGTGIPQEFCFNYFTLVDVCPDAANWEVIEKQATSLTRGT
jgi:tRNA A37 N6-isopentenylltransferase MiaA